MHAACRYGTFLAFPGKLSHAVAKPGRALERPGPANSPDLCLFELYGVEHSLSIPSCSIKTLTTTRM